MVRQWQEMFYDERYSEVYLSPDLPDYVKWAEAMGCVGIRVESPEEVQPAIDKANEIDDRPVVRRLPRRRPREGVPDGARRPVQRRHRAAPQPGQGEPCDDLQPIDGGGPTTTSCRCSSRTRPACWPGWRRCSPGAASTSSPWPSRRRRTIASAASRSWSTSSRHRSSRSSKQLFKLIDVVKITELDPRTVGGARAAAGDGAGRARPAGPGRRAGADLRGQDPRRRHRGHHRLARRQSRQARRLRGAAAGLWHRGAPAHRPGCAPQARP